MLEKILVPLDGSPLADGVLAQVGRILRRKDAEVMLARVVPPIPGKEDVAALEAARDDLARRAEQLRGEGATVSTRVLSGEPAAELVAFADEYRPSLIALSTHGRTGIGRWVRGSVAERVLRAASFPLLLVNPFGIERGHEQRERRFRKILVALDLSDASASVLPLVADLARLYDSEIVLFHAVETLVGDFTTGELIAATWKGAEDWLDEKRRAVERPARVKVVAGPAAGAILDAAEEEKADLIAMTTHGRSGASRWIFGSVAEIVLRHCACPLLVRRTAAPEPGRARAERG